MLEFGTLAHHWDLNIESLIGKSWSRKYNGFSILWDGGITQGLKATEVPWYYKGVDKDDVVSTGLWTLGRGGKVKVSRAPKMWLDKLPRGMPLHGELWNDDKLEYIKTHARTHSPRWANWRSIQLLVFAVKPYELWGIDGTSAFFSNDLSQGDYLEVLKNFIPVKDHFDSEERSNEVVRLVKQTPIESIADAQEALDIFKKSNWEGLMFLDSDAVYQRGRSHTCEKFKPKYDLEGVIVGVNDAKKGKHFGLVGSVEIKFTWTEQVTSFHGGKSEMIGQEVLVSVSGLTDDERAWGYFTLGDMLDFTFLNISSLGIPQSCMLKRG